MVLPCHNSLLPCHTPLACPALWPCHDTLLPCHTLLACPTVSPCQSLLPCHTILTCPTLSISPCQDTLLPCHTLLVCPTLSPCHDTLSLCHTPLGCPTLYCHAMIQYCHVTHAINIAKKEQKTDICRYIGHLFMKRNCGNCEKQFSSSQGLSFHKQSVHIGIHYSCNKCS